MFDTMIIQPPDLPYPIQRLPNRNDLLDLVPKGGQVVEIGVLVGWFSKNILERCAPARFYLLDFWHEATPMGRYEENGNFVVDVYHPQQSYDHILDLYGQRNDCVILRGISYHVMTCLAPKSLDMVYIDADHSYESCKKDLESSLPRIKSGGWIMGHDYCSVFPGVVRAVNEFCEKNDLKIDYLTDEPPQPTNPTNKVATFVAYNSFAIQVP